MRKIFISHSSKDRDYGEALVKLLRGIGLAPSQIIFSSNPEYGILAGVDIYDYLSTQIHNNAHMLYLLSDHYYDSIACMNEMGAAWVMQNTYHMLTLPGFDYRNDKFQSGAANPRTMAMRIDDEIRIRSFVDGIQKEFALSSTSEQLDHVLAEYLSEVQEIKQANQNSVEGKLKNINQEILRDPQNDALYCERARLLFNIQEQHSEVHPKIVQDCLYAAFLNPKNMDAYYLLLQTAAKHREYFGTELLTEILCERYPKDSELYGCRGYINCAKKRYEQAIADCNYAISVSRGSVNRWYYNTRGRCYLNLGEYDAALDDFRKAHELDPSYSPAIINIDITAGKIGGAELFRRGKEAHKREELETAKFYLEAACRLEPMNESFLTECGGIHYDLKEGKEAFHYWKRLLAQQKSCTSYFLCGVSLLMQNKAVEAEPYFQSAPQYPDYPFYRDRIQGIRNKYYRSEEPRKACGDESQKHPSSQETE